MPYVYSTLPCGVIYNGYRDESNINGVPVVTRGVEIKGGAGVADQHFITPNGVVTSVTDEELAFLQTHDLFNMHLLNGYLKVEGKEKPVDKVVSDMARGDGSSPITPADVSAETADVKIVAAGETVA